MGTRNIRGYVVPTAGEGLLAAQATTADTLGVIAVASSSAAARTALTGSAALVPPATINATYPAYFLIGGILYFADGTKNASVWVLKPVNEIEVDEKTYTTGAHVNLAQGAWSAMISSGLPARPYDRVVDATGYAYGQVTAGLLNLGIRIGSAADQSRARFTDGKTGSAAVANSGIIRAGVAPVIQMGVLGDHPTLASSGNMGVSGEMSKLIVKAYPITMA